jgi:hypothetical protein
MARSADQRLLDQVPPAGQPGVVLTVDPVRCTVTVRLPRVGGGPHGPMPYAPVPVPVGGEVTVRHPARGTRCLVIEDADDRMWVPVWALTT